ncbi:hypothetical protein MA16_Dca015224 [Dendrobium catenatum]|uniref:Uncharacterized protein n=1 Tax=Dendrobium catenatum TaxID=906689 RepID=A0A2I0VSD1_9ASPA|nr:hypothetical protein MA16_Dca015224 [Dendrobium catenatum]
MAVEGRWSPAVPPTSRSPLEVKFDHGFDDSMRPKSGSLPGADGNKKRLSSGIVIKDFVENVPKVSFQVEDKGKGIACDFDCKTPCFDKAYGISPSKPSDNQASFSGLKIFVNRLWEFKCNPRQQCDKCEFPELG